MRKCLNLFCDKFVQKVSVEKTKIMFSNNVEISLAHKISEWSGYSRSNNLGKYLGVPIFHNKISYSTYSYVVKKVQERLLGWKVENLSMVGKVTLCKSVILALPIYVMQFISLPKSICNEIEKMYRKFV